MQIKSARTLEELSEVLKNPNSQGPETAYWVFNELSERGWENMTVLAPGNYDNEFVKTYGHYHSQDVEETYKLIHGQGIFILQKRKFGDDDWVPDEIDKVLFVETEIGDEIIISPEWGHGWTNLGNEPLITFDNWRSGHIPEDYEQIKDLQGMCYYITKENGKINFIKNPNYKETPDPEFITAKEFKDKY